MGMQWCQCGSVWIVDNFCTPHLQYRSEPIRHQNRSELNPEITFRVYLEFTLSLLFEHLWGSFTSQSDFTRGFLLDTLKCEVDPFLILLSFACNSCTLYIPNTHVASAFRCILLIRVYSLCSLWVYFTMFTLDLLWVHFSRPVVNPAFTPKCLSLVSVRLDLISTVIMHKCSYLKAGFECIKFLE